MTREGYRDELAAAHARIALLEAELAAVRPRHDLVSELRARRAALVAKEERGVRLIQGVKKVAFTASPFAFVALWLAGDFSSGAGVAFFLLFLGTVLPGRNAPRTYEKARLARIDERIAAAERAASAPRVRARIDVEERAEEQVLEDEEPHGQLRATRRSSE